MNELALFAGAGGGILGGKLLGWRTVCAVEINKFKQSRLIDRQNEGHLHPFPIWDDVTTFNGYPWRGIVDIVSGGFPCQDISPAGKQAGIQGQKSGLWKEMSRIISEIRPAYVLVENSPALTHLGLDRVLGDLASMGFDAEWGVLGANEAGRPQSRKRIWILGQFSNPLSWEREMGRDFPRGQWVYELDEENVAWQAKGEPPMVGVADGVADRMDELRAIGDGQVPGVVALAFCELYRRLNDD